MAWVLKAEALTATLALLLGSRNRAEAAVSQANAAVTQALALIGVLPANTSYTTANPGTTPAANTYGARVGAAGGMELLQYSGSAWVVVPGAGTLGLPSRTALGLYGVTDEAGLLSRVALAGTLGVGLDGGNIPLTFALTTTLALGPQPVRRLSIKSISNPVPVVTIQGTRTELSTTFTAAAGATTGTVAGAVIGDVLQIQVAGVTAELRRAESVSGSTVTFDAPLEGAYTNATVARITPPANLPELLTVIGSGLFTVGVRLKYCVGTLTGLRAANFTKNSVEVEDSWVTLADLTLSGAGNVNAESGALVVRASVVRLENPDIRVDRRAVITDGYARVITEGGVISGGVLSVGAIEARAGCRELTVGAETTVHGMVQSDAYQTTLNGTLQNTRGGNAGVWWGEACPAGANLTIMGKINTSGGGVRSILLRNAGDTQLGTVTLGGNVGHAIATQAPLDCDVNLSALQLGGRWVGSGKAMLIRTDRIRTLTLEADLTNTAVLGSTTGVAGLTYVACRIIGRLAVRDLATDNTPALNVTCRTGFGIDVDVAVTGRNLSSGLARVVGGPRVVRLNLSGVDVCQSATVYNQLVSVNSAESLTVNGLDVPTLGAQQAKVLELVNCPASLIRHVRARHNSASGNGIVLSGTSAVLEYESVWTANSAVATFTKVSA